MPDNVTLMTNNASTSSKVKLGRAEEPGAPGPVPHPDHEVGVPAAPSTNPPEPPIVPSDSALGELWNSYGPSLLLIGAGLLIVVVLLGTFEN